MLGIRTYQNFLSILQDLALSEAKIMSSYSAPEKVPNLRSLSCLFVHIFQLRSWRHTHLGSRIRSFASSRPSPGQRWRFNLYRLEPCLRGSVYVCNRKPRRRCAYMDKATRGAIWRRSSGSWTRHYWNRYPSDEFALWTAGAWEEVRKSADVTLYVESLHEYFSNGPTHLLRGHACHGLQGLDRTSCACLFFWFLLFIDTIDCCQIIY